MRTENYMVYVEDDEDDLMLMEEIMNQQNSINFVSVSDGQELLDFLEDQRDGELPSLVVMDNNTPRLSGIETARKIKEDEQFKNIPLVLLSTVPPKSDEAFCRQNNISIETKPSTFAQWEALSQSFINRCRTV